MNGIWGLRLLVSMFIKNKNYVFIVFCSTLFLQCTLKSGNEGKLSGKLFSITEIVDFDKLFLWF
jgi:hypothetical protein